MNLEGVCAALSVEVKRWDELRNDGAAKLETEMTDIEIQDLRKSLLGEYNAHMRRIDSLWRQFTDDYRREKAVPI